MFEHVRTALLVMDIPKTDEINEKIMQLIAYC